MTPERRDYEHLSVNWGEVERRGRVVIAEKVTSIEQFLAQSNVVIDRSICAKILLENAARHIHLSLLKRCGKSTLLRTVQWFCEQPIDAQTGEFVKVGLQPTAACSIGVTIQRSGRSEHPHTSQRSPTRGSPPSAKRCKKVCCRGH